jgi:hypothetical protein
VGVAGFVVATTSRAATEPRKIQLMPFTKYVIDPSPRGAVVEKTLADIDGDGRLDAVIGMQSSPTQSGSGIYWYRFPSSGNPADVWVKHTILPSGKAYEDMTARDVNQDGRVDIVASVDSTISWFQNPGTLTGTWQRFTIGPGYGESVLALGDLDGDGRFDIATNAYLYFQNSPTSWRSVRFSSSWRGMALLGIGSGAGAINLVGNAPRPPYRVVWYQNPREGDGNARTDAWTMRSVGRGWACSRGAAQCPTEAVGVFATGDLNGDRRMDVVGAQAEGTPPPPGGLKWFEAPPKRTQPWIQHSLDPTFRSAHNIRLADVDGNGAVDLVLGEQEQSKLDRVAIFYNDARGHFTRQVLSTDASHNVSVGDADGDGDTDILASPHGYFGHPHALSLYLNGRF